jgi:peptidoglycan hydrolase-like protein with peptidoglycan-binding domain
LLAENGCFHYNCDGVYGAKTEEAVKGFQKQNGLSCDGMVGPNTLKALKGENYGQTQSSSSSSNNLA